MKNLVVLISGNGSNLQSIINACKKGFINARIVAVFSNKSNARGLLVAHNAGIKTHVLNVQNFKDRSNFDDQLILEIDSYTPDLVILSGYMLILGANFVDHYYKRLINIHPSLLPKYPGLFTYKKVLQNKDVEHGTTVHFVTKDLDAGPIILQSRITIFDNDTEESIIARVKSQEHLIYPLAIRWLIQERLHICNDKVWLDKKFLLPQSFNKQFFLRINHCF